MSSKPLESQRSVQADGCFHMYTHPRVACLICKIRRVAPLRAKALLEAERVACIVCNRIRVVQRGIFPAPILCMGRDFFRSKLKEEE